MIEERKKYSRIFLIMIVCTTLIGGSIRLGFASLYHFVLFGILFYLIAPQMRLVISRNNYILRFLLLFFLEALISVVWAPDKGMAFQYIYYVLLIFIMAYLIDRLCSFENLDFFIAFMVVLLFILNLIGIWESITNHHIVAGYLSGGRARLFAYVPAGFFYNANDFSTYIVQIIPFSFVACLYGKGLIRKLSYLNLFLSVYVVFRTYARTHIILLMLLFLVFFFMTMKAKKVIRLLCLIILGLGIVYYVYPSASDLILDGLSSISSQQIMMSSMEGGSLGTRIALLKNAGMICLDTFGFGIGAGCHRVVMKNYSAHYFNAGDTLVMHNLLGEILADYGILITVFFLYTLVKSIKSLLLIYKYSSNKKIQSLSIMFIATLCMFLICGISSSSIIPLASMWVTFCYIGVYIRICLEKLNCNAYDYE